MLIGRQPDFGVGLAQQTRHGHAVVIDQPDPARGRDHDIAVLQVAMDDSRGCQFLRHVEPVFGRPGQGSRIAGQRRSRAQSNSVAPSTQSIVSSG